jgi:hypothetical protein
MFSIGYSSVSRLSMFRSQSNPILHPGRNQRAPQQAAKVEGQIGLCAVAHTLLAGIYTPEVKCQEPGHACLRKLSLPNV